MRAHQGRRSRTIRLFDIAASLYVYLLVLEFAGLHAYAAVAANPSYQPVSLEKVAALATTESAPWRQKRGEEPGVPIDAILPHLQETDRQRLSRLQEHVDNLASRRPNVIMFDEAIFLAELLRPVGTRLAANRKTGREGATIVVMTYDVEKQIAERLTGLNIDSRYWNRHSTGGESES